jgi:hypothetical protein
MGYAGRMLATVTGGLSRALRKGVSGRASGWPVTQPDPGFFFQQGNGEEFPVDRSVAAQGALVNSFHERRQLEGHVMFAG